MKSKRNSRSFDRSLRIQGTCPPSQLFSTGRPPPSTRRPRLSNVGESSESKRWSVTSRCSKISKLRRTRTKTSRSLASSQGVFVSGWVKKEAPSIEKSISKLENLFSCPACFPIARPRSKTPSCSISSARRAKKQVSTRRKRIRRARRHSCPLAALRQAANQDSIAASSLRLLTSPSSDRQAAPSQQRP